MISKVEVFFEFLATNTLTFLLFQVFFDHDAMMPVSHNFLNLVNMHSRT
jgi:hypothetical protein